MLIHAAAIKDNKGRIHTLPRPCRHADIYMNLEDISDHVQGFITSSGEFVSREIAYIIAHNSNQIIYPNGVTPTPGTLYTEDLW